MYGLIALKEILTKDCNDKNARLAMVLLVHVTKMDMAIKDSATYFEHFVNIEEITGRDVSAWRTLGHKVFAHNGVRYTVTLSSNDFSQNFCRNAYRTTG